MTEIKSREQYVAEGGTNIPEYNPLVIWPYFCAINVFKAMLDEVGLNQSIEAIRHYNDALGRALVGMVKERLGEQASDLETIAITAYYVHNCSSMGHIKPLEIYEGGAVCELFSCPNPGMEAPPEVCIAASHVWTKGCCQLVNPDYEFIFTHHMGNGDDCCRWVLKRKTSKYTVDELGRLVKTIPLELSVEERGTFAMRNVIIGQLSIFTSALIDLVGSERTLELVVPLARETGIRLGTMIKDGASAKGDAATIKEKMDLLTSFLLQHGPPTMITSSSAEREITDCPLKGASPEVCRQFEGVLKGVCEAIDPDYEFCYDRMMSEGEPTCHWIIRKRKEEVEGESGEKATIDDPARMLALRFAKGEISREEFEMSMEVLKKHQVVR